MLGEVSARHLRAAQPTPMRVTRRSLAILPQVPVLSNRLIRKEERLRKIAESSCKCV